MIRALAVICLLSATLSQAANSCQCQASFWACNEVAGSDVAFNLTVQSIDPPSLNLWGLPNPSSERALNDAYTDARLHPSAAALTRLKDTYLNMQDAKTIDDVTSLFYSALDHGMRIRFQVKTLFKRGDDDKGSKLLATGKSTRTRRLSDAGDALKDHPEESARLEGFTTTNELYQLGFDSMHDPETIQSIKRAAPDSSFCYRKDGN